MPDPIMMLPEVILNISNFLDHSSLASSVHVSKEWNRILIPLLYRSITDKQRQPSQEALTKYGHHVQHLNISYTGEKQTTENLAVYITRPARLQKLKELELSFKNCPLQAHYLNAVILVARNQNLQKLTIEDNHPLGAPVFVDDDDDDDNDEDYGVAPVDNWKYVLDQCGLALRELCLRSIRLDCDEVKALFRLGESLAKLEIWYCAVDWFDLEDFSANPQFPKMEELLIIYSGSTIVCQELRWFQQCPNLKRLNWHSSEIPEVPDIHHFSCQLLRTCQWSYLQSIELKNRDSPFSDSQIALVLDACRMPLKVVNFGDSKFWYRSLNALERHYGTLTSLSLAYCKNVHSFFMQHILSSCPNLDWVYGGVLQAHEFGTGRRAEIARRQQMVADAAVDDAIIETEILDQEHEDPEGLRVIMERYKALQAESVQVIKSWVCKDIDHLETTIKFPLDGTSGRGWDIHVFRALAKLTKLQDLSVWLEVDPFFDMFARLPKARGLAMDLSSGLAELAPLTRLEFLSFGGEQQMEKEDVLGIVNQWPKLKVLSGLPDEEEEEIGEELQELARAQNPSLRLL
ncbi:hypothetical protein BGZ83_002597 [Gryganskiella cystojenkinii]|nr:hypothetical protein BGZ83_002597 [Gryganskiella cystojenkinii]